MRRKPLSEALTMRRSPRVRCRPFNTPANPKVRYGFVENNDGMETVRKIC